MAYDSDLRNLARIAGLAVRWKDAFGKPRTVTPESIRSILNALGYACHTPSAIAESAHRLAAAQVQLSPMMVTSASGQIPIPTKSRRAKLVLEDGSQREVAFSEGPGSHSLFRAPEEVGYHALEFGTERLLLANAPACLTPVWRRKRGLWGIAVQLYSLPGGSTKEFGDFSALAEVAELVAAKGADAVAMSPIHALLPGALEHYSPYSPSSRLFLNPLFSSVNGKPASQRRSGLVDWTIAYPNKVNALRRSFTTFRASKRDRELFSRFVAEGGDRLLLHACFEALQVRFSNKGYGGWRSWPTRFRDASQVLKIADRSNPEVEFQLYLQWLADAGVGEAHKRALSAGMKIGIIADLAVGTDPNGSDVWSTPDEMLSELTIGAPADQLGPDGQNWGLTALSPHALRNTAFRGYIATLRAAMRNTGGVRIDHAMGMQRLWVIPKGAPSYMGAYLNYPFHELLRLTTLEAFRHKAVVIAEDLGTVPHNYRAQLAKTGFAGMRVLWFERNAHGDFLPPSQWSREACALTTTHDLPTLSGWWRGRDIDWRSKLSPVGRFQQGARKERVADRKRLWQALKKAKCVQGRQPRPDQPLRMVDGALNYVAKVDSALSLFPLEDITGSIEQPNLPGTVDVHPNWKQRLSKDRLTDRRTRRRFAIISAQRASLSTERKI